MEEEAAAEGSLLFSVLLRSGWLLLVGALLGTVLLKLLVYVIEPVHVKPELHYRSSALSKLLLDTVPWLSEVTIPVSFRFSASFF